MQSDFPSRNAPLSLPIRMAVKQKTRRSGIAALLPGVVLVVASGYAFSLGGAEVLGVLTGTLGLGLCVLGAVLLKKSTKAY